MAQFTTANAIGEREDLSDVITRIDPDETPIFSALKKETGNGVFVEWQVQELAAAVATNYQNEGADATYDTPTATTRLGNYMQISQKDAQVSGTLDAVDKAGRDKEGSSARPGWVQSVSCLTCFEYFFVYLLYLGSWCAFLCLLGAT